MTDSLRKNITFHFKSATFSSDDMRPGAAVMKWDWVISSRQNQILKDGWLVGLFSRKLLSPWADFALCEEREGEKPESPGKTSGNSSFYSYNAIPRPRKHYIFLFSQGWLPVYNCDSRGKMTSAVFGHHFETSETKRLSLGSPCCPRVLPSLQNQSPRELRAFEKLNECCKWTIWFCF